MLKKAAHQFLYALTRLHGGKVLRDFYRHAAACRETQERVLFSHIRRCASTEYGRRHGFGSIRTVADFKKAAPIVDYNGLAASMGRIVNGERNVLFPERERALMFAMTSGTTATPKYIPVTQAYLTELRRGNLVWGIHLIKDYPAVLNHKILHIVSPSRESETSNGVPCGAATGLVAEMQKRVARYKYALRPDIYGIKDYSSKYYCIVRLALQHEMSLVIAANPSTLVAIGRCMEERTEDLLRDIHDGTLTGVNGIDRMLRDSIQCGLRRLPRRAAELSRAASRAGRFLPRYAWPEIKAIGCWTGGTLTPYLPLVTDYWGEKPLRDPGLIASEGRMTIPVTDGEAGGLLDVDGYFFEFLPYDNGAGENDTLLAHELEAGKKYYLVMSTPYGFFRYNISDVVEVSGRVGDTPILKFLHKGNRMSSLTGEKVSEYQVVQAFRLCEETLGFSVPLFTVCPGWGEPPFYYIVVEEGNGLHKGSGRAHGFAKLGGLFDATLGGLNMEYKSKRESQRIGPPRVKLVRKGSFENKRNEHIRKSGGRLEQYKHPYLHPGLDHCKTF
jgi:hypothetical protein